MVEITGSTIFYTLFAILIVVVVALSIVKYKQEGWNYPIIRYAMYMGVTFIGGMLLLSIPLNPDLNKQLTDNISIGSLAVALMALGYTALMQYDSDYKQDKFETSIKSDLQLIKSNFGITGHGQTNDTATHVTHMIRISDRVAYLSPLVVVLILAGFSYMGGDLILCSGLLGAAFVLMIKPFL